MKTLFAALILIFSIQSMASIVCHTPRMNKIFEIKENHISFFNEFSENKNREIASLVSRSKSDATGVTKIVDFENQKHTIHIENTNNFSDVNDYLLIKNKMGHEMMYPITCQNK
jgi:hypothetical protein